MASMLHLPSLTQEFAAGDVIGRGDNANVYSATDRRNGRNVAIKLFYQHVELDTSFVAFFRREARRARALDHPHVVHTFGYGYADGHYYLVLERVDGGTFQQLIPSPGLSPSSEAIGALLDVCIGLQYMHDRGLVHGMLAPTNILLRTNGEAVIGDVGPVYRAGGSGMTMTQSLVASVSYSSPEAILGSGLTPASDIYSFGLLLYQTFTGTLPFDAANPVQLATQQISDAPPWPQIANRSISSGVADVILRCLQKDPAQRYASMRHVGDALLNAVSESLSQQSSDTSSVQSSVNQHAHDGSPTAWLGHVRSTLTHLPFVGTLKRPRPEQSAQTVVIALPLSEAGDEPSHWPLRRLFFPVHRHVRGLAQRLMHRTAQEDLHR